MKYVLVLLTAATIAWSADPTQQLNLPDEPTGFRFYPSPIVWPAEHGEADLCWWEGDKDAALSITIDDNMVHEHSWWKSQGERLGFRFTWFVITSRCSDSDWDSFRDLVASGHDAQSHTENHVGASGVSAATYATEYAGAIADIEAEIPDYRCLTMAYPNGLGNETEAAKLHVAARGVYGLPNQVYRIWYMNTNSMHFNDDYVMKIATQGAGGLYWRGWMSIHIHNLNEDGGATVIQAHLDYIKSFEDNIWVGKWKDVARYGQSRDTHVLTVGTVTDDYVTYTLADSMDDDYYDYPLTVKVRINNDWSDPVAEQNGTDCELTVVENAGNKYALVSTVPDRGTVVLAKDAAALAGIRTLNAVRPLGVDEMPRAMFDVYGRQVRSTSSAPGMYLMYDGTNVLKALMR